MTSEAWPQPKALLLDIDNTIYAYEPCHLAGIAASSDYARASALWDTTESFQKAYGAARDSVKARLRSHAASHSRLLYFKEMIETRFGFTRLDRVREMEARYWEGYASCLTVEPGCREVLLQALHSGIRLAWVSNFTTERQMWKLRHLGLESLASVLVTSEEAGADKPDPAMLDLAFSRLGIAARDAWFIGDEPADEKAAGVRGLPILLLRRNGAAVGADRPRRRAVRTWNEIGEALGRARN